MIASFSSVAKKGDDCGFWKAVLTTEVDGFKEFDYVLMTDGGSTYSLWIHTDDFKNGQDADYVVHVDIIVREVTIPTHNQPE